VVSDDDFRVTKGPEPPGGWPYGTILGFDNKTCTWIIVGLGSLSKDPCVNGKQTVGCPMLIPFKKETEEAEEAN